MKRRRVLLTLCAAAGLLAGCTQSTQAAAVPLTTPACPAGQTLASASTGWTCLDPASIQGLVPTTAVSVAEATRADRADSAADAGVATRADVVRVLGSATLGDGGSAPDGGTTFQVFGADIVHDGNPVPGVATLDVPVPSNDGGTQLSSRTVFLPANRQAYLFASGVVQAPGTPTFPAACALLLTDVTNSQQLGEQDVYAFQSVDGGVAGGTSFVVSGTQGPFSKDQTLQLALELVSSDPSRRCTLQPGSAHFQVEAY